MFTLKEFLRKEVTPALGCTEPGAVALAVARACEEVGDRKRISSAEVLVSDSVYKNGIAVGIPGANGAKGNTLAAAISVLCGKSEYGLQVLKECTPEHVAEAKLWVEQKKAKVGRHPDKHGIYVEATVLTPEHQATCIIEDYHSNIVKVAKDGAVVFEVNRPQAGSGSIGEKSIPELVGQTRYTKLLELVEAMDEEDAAYLLEGVRMNKAIAEYGLQNDSISGLSLGKTIKTLMEGRKLEDSLGYLMRGYCYAASDARMGGAQMPVMSSAGSGNHGIAAILPIALAGERLGKSAWEIAKALAISHLSTSFVKSKIGRLSPVCGCAIAAGAGAAAGLTFLLGGNVVQAAQAMQTVLANTAGMICDGAKGSCALKVGTAACEAYFAALMALEGRGVDSPQGLVDESLEQTTDNVGRLNADGMRTVDQVMIEILEARDMGIAGRLVS